MLSVENLHSLATKTNYKSSIVSINQDEASDKVDVARMMYYSIPDEVAPLGLKPPLYINAADKLALHAPPHTSEMHSQPASAAIRGGSKDVYFDEAAHIRDFSKLYHAGLPAISRGNKRLTIISTPLGQSGLFYDIATDVDAFPQYSRHSVPWWEYSGFVKPGYYEEALAVCPEIDTVERVERFGTEKFKSIYEGFGGDIQSFQTEYEATFVDELSAYYPWSLILEATDDRLPIWRTIPNYWEPEGDISIGVDLAKVKDESVFTVVEHINYGSEEEPDLHHYVRHVEATQDDYDRQWERIKTLIRLSGATRVTIDKTGLGQVFVEKAQKDEDVSGARIEGVVFTNQLKEQWATSLKGSLQANTIHWPRIHDLMRQVHGIQRKKTEAGFYKFAGKRDDYFFSLCLALYGEGRPAPRISRL